jgi:hypothetical protein
VFAPEPFYTKTLECLIVLFNLRYPGAEERLRREQDAWDGFASAQGLTDGYSALIMRLGGATRVAS